MPAALLHGPTQAIYPGAGQPRSAFLEINHGDDSTCGRGSHPSDTSNKALTPARLRMQVATQTLVTESNETIRDKQTPLYPVKEFKAK